MCGQELGQLLSEPLQPRFSTRYFAGQAAVASASDEGLPTSVGALNTGAAEKLQHKLDAVALARQLAAGRKAALAGAEQVGAALGVCVKCEQCTELRPTSQGKSKKGCKSVLFTGHCSAVLCRLMTLQSAACCILQHAAAKSS